MLKAEALKWGQWLPDQAPLGNPGCMVAENVLPNRSSYSSLDNLQPFSNALPGPCVAALLAYDSQGERSHLRSNPLSSLHPGRR